MLRYWQWTGKCLTRPFRTALALRRSVQQFGGLRHIVRRALSLSRSEGLSGVLRGASALRAATRRQGTDWRNDYTKWVLLYDTLSSGQRDTIAQFASTLPVRPLISVIMPVYNPRPQWLEAAIESVRRQIYANWELCIADDASTDPTVAQVLRRYASIDERIRVTFRERNGHISASSNTALAAAKGDWIVLFDHDDLLSDHALFWVADAVNRHSDAGLIYSDEDKITEAGVRCVPHFKPDWNYELFLAYNFICHLGAYRRALVEEVGGFREGLEGAQDYDLALRCVERLSPSQIIHVPRVLYHWRMHAGSTAVGGQSKPYALPAGERALNDHFSRQGVRARAALQPAGYYLPRYEPSAPAPTLSLIITMDVRTVGTAAGLSDLPWPSWYPRLEVVRVDEGDSLEASIDQAVAGATGDFVAVLSSELRPASDEWLWELVSLASQPGVGIVGPRIVDHDGAVWSAGLIFGIRGSVGRAHHGLRLGDTGYFYRAILSQALSAVPDGCVVVRKALFRQAGGLSNGGLRGAVAQADLCLRIGKEGFRTVYAGHVALHRCAAARPPNDGPRWHADAVAQLAAAPPAVRERWANVLEADPGYNPNLTLLSEDFALAWPGRIDALPTGYGHSATDRPSGQETGLSTQRPKSTP